MKHWWGTSTPNTADLSQDENLSSEGVSKHEAQHAANHVANLALMPTEGIIDSGTTGHFFYFLPPSKIFKQHQTHHNNFIRWQKTLIYSHMQSGSPMVTSPLNQGTCHTKTISFLPDAFKAIYWLGMKSGFWQRRMQSVLRYTVGFNRKMRTIIRTMDSPSGFNGTTRVCINTQAQPKHSISATNANTNVEPHIPNHIQAKIDSIPPSMWLQSNYMHMDSSNQ